MRDEMKSVLVTGGAGFIGSNLVHWLIQNSSARVTNLDNLTYAGNLDSLAAISDDHRYELVHGDIADRTLVSATLRRVEPDTIFHLAAESHVDRSIDGPLQFAETNVLGTCQLLQATREYWSALSQAGRAPFRFVHVSTDEVFGQLGSEGRFTEQTAYAPNSPYSASKAAADHFVRAYHHTYQLPTIITNCSNNYGPRQFPEKLIPLMILNALSGKPLPVYGDGGNIRDWLFVDDHCRALAAVAGTGIVGETYLIGGNCERTNLQVVRAICDAVSRARPDLSHDPAEQITFVEDRPGHDWRYAICTDKIERELGWRPEVAFDVGLQRTVEWYLADPEWVQRVTSGDYRGQRLGLNDRA